MTEIKKSCGMQCEHWAADMDGSYCSAPKVLSSGSPYGLSLSSRAIVEFCPAPEHPLYQLTTRQDRLTSLQKQGRDDD